MKQSRLRRLIALTVVLCMAITSMPAVGFATVTSAAPVTDSLPADQQVSSDNSLMPEGYIDLDTDVPVVSAEPKKLSEVTEDDIILEESDEASTTFDLGGGRKATFFYS